MIEWYRVTGVWFVCAVKVRDGQIVDACPILKWTVTRRDHSLDWLTTYAKKRRWSLELLPVGTVDKPSTSR